VDPPIAENFAGAIAMAENDPELRERIGKNGRRLVVERYGWEANAAQVIAACERAVAVGRQRY
jgi:glycosyltransferase involved in cell wall biosynthesis